MSKFGLEIRRGTLVNDDPQRRCYNGCYFASHVEWSAWEPWLTSMTFDTPEKAARAAQGFRRDTQQLRVVELTSGVK